jgi:hypothetical protein
LSSRKPWKIFASEVTYFFMNFHKAGESLLEFPYLSLIRSDQAIMERLK